LTISQRITVISIAQRFTDVKKICLAPLGKLQLFSSEY